MPHEFAGRQYELDVLMRVYIVQRQIYGQLAGHALYDIIGAGKIETVVQRHGCPVMGTILVYNMAIEIICTDSFRVRCSGSKHEHRTQRPVSCRLGTQCHDQIMAPVMVSPDVVPVRDFWELRNAHPRE